MANANEITVPSGSSLPAIITAGASLSKSAADINPVPMILKITDGKLKGCTVFVSSFADWTANRANVRLNKIICNDKEFDAQGWVVGDDDKAGISNKTRIPELMNINAGTKVKVVLSQALGDAINSDQLSFITDENKDPSIPEYFNKIFHNRVEAIYNTKYPDFYAIKLKKGVIVYGNTNSTMVLIGAAYNESSPYYNSIIDSFKFQGCQQ